MTNHNHRRTFFGTGLVLVPFLAVALLTTTLSSCAETKFPESPPPSPALDALEGWPDEYYWLVQTGVSSRVLGIRERGEGIENALQRVDTILTKVKQQWKSVGKLDTSDELITYFRGHELAPIAQAIEKTLDANKAREPSGEPHAWLQAKAIKDGLIDAHRKIKETVGT